MKFSELPEELQNTARHELRHDSKTKSIRLEHKETGAVIVSATHTKLSDRHLGTEFTVRKAPAKGKK